MSLIGFIGTGTIGAPIALRLCEHQHPLLAFDIDPQALSPLLGQGAKAASSISDIGAQCTTVFLSLPGPREIELVLLGKDGLINQLAEASTIVDLSTNSVSLNREIAELAEKNGIRYLDAPVSGGKVGAQKGTLAVMVGGAEAAFNEVRPLIETFGEHIFYMGGPGAGTLTKLVNNQIFLCASVLIQEGFVMGAKAGMDPSALLAALKKSSAGSSLGSAPLVLSGRYDRDLFALSIAAKDVGVALDSASAIGADMPLTQAAHRVYTEALALGLGDADFFATAKVLENAAGISLPPIKKS